MITYIYIGKTNAKGFKGAIKIGISKKVSKRWKGIDGSVKGSKEWVIMSGPVFNAKELEKRLHQKYKKYQKQFKGSGKTEWFVLPVFKRIAVVRAIMFEILLFKVFCLVVGASILLLLILLLG